MKRYLKYRRFCKAIGVKPFGFIEYYKNKLSGEVNIWQ